MEKPCANIEWCEGGYTMEEQAELYKQYYDAMPKVYVTSNFKAEAADKLISDLRVKLAANEEYIAELEETKEKNIQKCQSLEKELKSIRDKYSADLQKILSVDSVYQNQREKIKELETEVASLKNARDHLLFVLSSKS